MYKLVYIFILLQVTETPIVGKRFLHYWFVL